MPSNRIDNKRVFIIINPVSGMSNGQLLKTVCQIQFSRAGWIPDFHTTSKGEDLVPVIHEAIQNGADLVVAVGGDGTIAAVAAGLIDHDVPLGIVPAGTWNAIARHLYIPFNPVRAISLMTGKHDIREMDIMAVGDTYHAMNVSVGFSAKMNENASRENKRKMGAIAYLKQFLNLLFGLEMHKFIVEADGYTFRGRATEVFIANYGVAGLHLLEDRLDIHPDDGKVEVLIMRARTILDLPSMFWQMLILRQKRTPKYRQLSASQSVTIRTDPPSTVQADGEIIGQTPVYVTILPLRIRVIAPQSAGILLPQFR
jgi:YegS/Rv2252/BmrU family lipid kinase